MTALAGHHFDAKFRGRLSEDQKVLPVVHPEKAPVGRPAERELLEDWRHPPAAIGVQTDGVVPQMSVVVGHPGELFVGESITVGGYDARSSSCVLVPIS